MPRVTDDPVRFQEFFDAQRSHPVCLAGLGPPCWTLVLQFLHPDENGIYDAFKGMKSELWVSPIAIHFPTFRWHAELSLDWNIQSDDGDLVRQLTDKRSGILVRWSPDTVANLIIDERFSLPPDSTTEPIGSPDRPRRSS